MATFQEMAERILKNDALMTASRQAADNFDAAYEAQEAATDKIYADLHYPLYMADTMRNGTGSKYAHAHDHDARGGISAALCGAKPGKRGYWGYNFSSAVTCPRCIIKLAGEK